MVEAGACSSSPNLPRKKNFKYPMREFVKTKVVRRSFQDQWYDSFSWLDYDESKDVVYCYICRLADSQNKLHSTLLKEASFIDSGFSNWKDATARFRNHEKSNCHKIAVDNVIAHPAVKSVGVMIKHNQKMLLTILRGVQHLGRQGLAIRGDDDESNSNFVQTLKLLDLDGSMKKWMARKQNKYTSPVIQNEMLKLLALTILRHVGSNIQKGFFTIMCDECTDSSNKEQLVICLRWVDQHMDVHENFMGLYVIPNISADTIFGVVKDTLVRLNLGLSRCRGQCYDGASNIDQELLKKLQI